MKKFILLLAICPFTALAESERYYQNTHCQGIKEYVLQDRTRVDCLTDTHAIEYDFGPKWAEAIGQSLGYAFATNKKAGVVLILRSEKDYKYWIKLNSIIDFYKLPIDTWVIEP